MCAQTYIDIYTYIINYIYTIQSTRIDLCLYTCTVPINNVLLPNMIQYPFVIQSTINIHIPMNDVLLPNMIHCLFVIQSTITQ